MGQKRAPLSKAPERKCEHCIHTKPKEQTKLQSEKAKWLSCPLDRMVVSIMRTAGGKALILADKREYSLAIMWNLF
ncbi:hypothetical protein SERLADRAFT_391884, partial [Serpula lacrymans var. lacrymans S7.9]